MVNFVNDRRKMENVLVEDFKGFGVGFGAKAEADEYCMRRSEAG